MVGRHVAALFGAVLSASCAEQAAPRSQLLLFVDTDTPVIGQLEAHPELSRDAAIDMLHVEILGVNGETIQSRDFVADNATDWPISFGVVPSASSTRHLTIRLRGLNSGLVHGTDAQSLADSANVVIDRLVEVEVGTGMTVRAVTLRGDCMGTRTTFATLGSSATTCIDAEHRHGSPTDALARIDPEKPPPTLAGSWPLSVEKPCTAPAPDGAVCIPGGVSVLGELSLAGFTDGIEQWDPVPLRPAALSPFYLGRTELTVGTLRALVKAKRVAAPPTTAPGEFGQCQWLGEDDATHDAMPMNCVTRDLGESICEALGGALPTEAQWEHAARGRGKRYHYPWGKSDPACCTAAFLRAPNSTGQCPGPEIDPAGSNASRECDGPHDVTEDGVADLAGSLGEWTRDAFASYAAPCWPEGISLDPRCVDPKYTQPVYRGGAFASPSWELVSSIRHTPGNFAAALFGFRCAFPGSTP